MSSLDDREMVPLAGPSGEAEADRPPEDYEPEPAEAEPERGNPARVRIL
jgi:hypothetical protein